MKLTINDLSQAPESFTAKGVSLPPFDVSEMQRNARARPRWIHIGPGNIFRVFIARIAAEMIAAGHRWPITAVAPQRADNLDHQLSTHDLMTLGVTLHEDGRRDLQVIAGIGEGLASRRSPDFDRLTEIATSPDVCLVSLTITEKGYATHDSTGRLLGSVSRELDADPRGPHNHSMMLLAALLLRRFESGGPPITLLSCDNFHHNGDKLRDSVLGIIREWVSRGAAGQDFANWASDPARVAFPISVIDKITPQPGEQISADLTALGFTDMAISSPSGKPLAGFVNTEPTEYLVVEDAFAGQRPPLGDFGVSMTTREVCDDFERMKVTACLNPLHTALAVAGCLLRFQTIDSEMRDPALAALIHRLGWDEGLPVVANPGIIAPADFLREVEQVRFPNPYLPDSPARIATDTSQKIPIRFGETIKTYLAENRDLGGLTAVPLVFALWCRYLMAIADDGDVFEPSPDPLLTELQQHLSGVSLAGHGDVHAALFPILSNPAIFGLDLYGTPLGKRTENYFARLIAGAGAVRETLDREMNLK